MEYSLINILANILIIILSFHILACFWLVLFIYGAMGLNSLLTIVLLMMLHTSDGSLFIGSPDEIFGYLRLLNDAVLAKSAESLRSALEEAVKTTKRKSSNVEVA